MYVRSLRIKDLRCFAGTEVRLQYPEREQHSPPPLENVNLFLGNNGAGKTTVLKGISLAVLSRILGGSGYVPYSLVRRGKTRAHIQAELILQDQDSAGGSASQVGSEIAIRRIRDTEEIVVARADEDELLFNFRELFDDDSPAFLLVGYGATRYVVDSSNFEPIPSQLKRRRRRYQRVAGLFEDHLGLAPLDSWLPQLEHRDPVRFQEVGDLLNELLPEEARFFARKENDEYLFEHLGVPVPLGALSDGYRAYLGWISDLLYNVSLSAPEGSHLRDAYGVVLVDEIDLHLHPEWQREVVPTVALALPNLQFVFTSHSPIVAGTLSPQNIFLLEMDRVGASTIRQLKEPIHGLNADQILVSPYFGLETTRAAEAVTELRELSKEAMSGDSAAAVAFLTRITYGTDPSPGKEKTQKKSVRESTRRPRRTRAK